MTLPDSCITIGKKAAAVTVRHQLGAGLGVGVRVKTVQPVVFPVAPGPALVLIDFICGDDHHRPYRYL